MSDMCPRQYKQHDNHKIKRRENTTSTKRKIKHSVKITHTKEPRSALSLSSLSDYLWLLSVTNLLNLGSRLHASTVPSTYRTSVVGYG